MWGLPVFHYKPQLKRKVWHTAQHTCDLLPILVDEIKMN